MREQVEGGHMRILAHAAAEAIVRGSARVGKPPRRIGLVHDVLLKAPEVPVSAPRGRHDAARLT